MCGFLLILAEKFPFSASPFLQSEGSANRVDEYYQQQEEMLEGFTEMDVLTDGIAEYASKVRGAALV